MKKILPVLFIVFLIFSCTPSQEHKSVLASDPDNGGITLPDGFSALVVGEVGHGRHIDVNDNGDIYISLSQHEGNKGIACLRDTTGDGKADIIVYTGEDIGTGIKIHKGYLYFLFLT